MRIVGVHIYYMNGEAYLWPELYGCIFNTWMKSTVEVHLKRDYKNENIVFVS